LPTRSSWMHYSRRTSIRRTRTDSLSLEWKVSNLISIFLVSFCPLTLDVRRHHSARDSTPLQQDCLCPRRILWLEISRRQAWRERHIRACCVGIHHEDVGAGHLALVPGLSDTNPLVRGGAFDLNVKIRAVGGGNVDAIADAASCRGTERGYLSGGEMCC